MFYSATQNNTSKYTCFDSYGRSMIELSVALKATRIKKRQEKEKYNANFSCGENGEH